MFFYLHGQVVKWSFTIPTDCIKEYTIVGPTNLKPSLRRALRNVSASGVKAGTSAIVVYSLIIGLWSTKLQQKASKLPYFS